MSLKSLSKLNKMLETLTDKEIGENKLDLKRELSLVWMAAWMNKFCF